MRRSWRNSGWYLGLALSLACTGNPATPAGGDGISRLTVRISGGSQAALLALAGWSASASEPGGPANELIAGATVTIGAVELVGGEDGPIVLTAEGGEFDLMNLRDGVTDALAAIEVPAGTYTQLRLVVQAASVTLVDGTTFADGESTHDLFVPSGAQTGIKIQLDDDDDVPGTTIEEGEALILLELDVARNFVLTGPRSAPHSAIFTPSVRVAAAP